MSIPMSIGSKQQQHLTQAYREQPSSYCWTPEDSNCPTSDSYQIPAASNSYSSSASSGYSGQSTQATSGIYPPLELNIDTQYQNSSETQRGVASYQPSSTLQYALRTQSQSPQHLRSVLYSQSSQLDYSSLSVSSSTVVPAELWPVTAREHIPYSIPHSEHYRSSGSISGEESPSAEFSASALPISTPAHSASEVYANSERSTYSGLHGLPNDQQGPLNTSYSAEPRAPLSTRQQSNTILSGYLGGRGQNIRYNLGYSKISQVKREPEEDGDDELIVPGSAPNTQRYNSYSLYKDQSDSSRFVRERGSRHSVTGEIVSSSTPDEIRVIPAHGQNSALRVLTQVNSLTDNETATHSPNDSYNQLSINSATYTRYDYPSNSDGEGIAGLHILASGDPSLEGAGVAAGTVEPHALTAPLRAVNASKEMRALMGVFRLDPFQTLNGISLRPGVDGTCSSSKGNGGMTWDGGEAGPLESEPVMFEFPLAFEGMLVDSDEESPDDRGARDSPNVKMPSLENATHNSPASELRMQPHDSLEEEKSPVLYSFDQDDVDDDFVPDFGYNRKDETNGSSLYHLSSHAVSNRTSDAPRSIIFDRSLEQQRLGRTSGVSHPAVATSPSSPFPPYSGLEGAMIPETLGGTSSSILRSPIGVRSLASSSYTDSSVNGGIDGTELYGEIHGLNYGTNTPSTAHKTDINPDPQSTAPLQQIRSQPSLRVVSSHTVSSGNRASSHPQQSSLVVPPVSLYTQNALVQSLSFTPTPASVAAQMHAQQNHERQRHQARGRALSSASVSTQSTSQSPIPRLNSGLSESFTYGMVHGINSEEDARLRCVTNSGPTSYVIASALGTVESPTPGVNVSTLPRAAPDISTHGSHQNGHPQQPMERRWSEILHGRAH